MKQKVNKKWIFITALLIALPIAWYLISPAFIVVEKNEEFPVSEDLNENQLGNSLIENSKIESVILKQANFIASAHDVKGKALIINGNGKQVLRFQDFETINGPDLFIYLSSDLNADDFINLGEIKATKGNVNYELPSNVDLTKYNKVLVWCRAFRVLFSYAELK